MDKERFYLYLSVMLGIDSALSVLFLISPALAITLILAASVSVLLGYFLE